MPTLFEDASNGSLNANSLQTYVSADRNSINAFDNNSGYTPLMAAVVNGQLGAVRLLLKNQTGVTANASQAQPNGHTALFFATTGSPKKDRAAIVQALLDGGANKDEVYASEGNVTPLMLAISEIQDEAVVRVLVDAGASQTMESTKKDTAKTLAQEFGMESSLKPKSERDSTLAQIVDLLGSFVKFVIVYSGLGIIKDAVGDLAKKLFNYKDKTLDPNIQKNFGTPDKSKDFEQAATTYVKNSGLDKFFPPGDPFVATLAKNAANLKEEHLKTPENIKRLTYLSLYQLVIYCDDSGSMDEGTRWADQREMVERITRLSSKLLPEEMGVELKLINQDTPPSGTPPKTNNLSGDEVKAALTTLKPNGGTPIGTGLHNRVLKPFVYDPIANNNFKRPVLICTITDGCPNSETRDTFKNKIVECVDTLGKNKYDSSNVMFSVSRVGNDPEAIEFLKELEKQHMLEDVLFCTTEALDDTFNTMRENDRGFEVWLLKLLTAPLLGED